MKRNSDPRFIAIDIDMFNELFAGYRDSDRDRERFDLEAMAKHVTKFNAHFKSDYYPSSDQLQGERLKTEKRDTRAFVKENLGKRFLKTTDYFGGRAVYEIAGAHPTEKDMVVCKVVRLEKDAPGKVLSKEQKKQLRMFLPVYSIQNSLRYWPVVDILEECIKK